MALLLSARVSQPLIASPAHPDGEPALVARAQAGDRAAFALLYDRYVDPIYRACYRRLGRKEDAEDATSLVFTNAFAALPSYRVKRGSFRGWLFAIAHNVLIDQMRSRRPTASLTTLDPEDVGDPAPEAALLRTEDARTVRDLLASLPPLQAHLLEFRVAGLTWAEIAIALGSNPTALRVAHHRALVHLRRRLEPEREGTDG